MRPVVAITDGFAEREARWRSFGLEGLTELQKAGGIFRNAVEAGVFDMALAVNDRIADHAKRYGDPLVVAGTVALG